MYVEIGYLIILGGLKMDGHINYNKIPVFDMTLDL